MGAVEKSNEWAMADRISAAITELGNAEIAKPGFASRQLLAGHLLALLALMRSAPKDVPIPESWTLLRETAVLVLDELVEAYPS